MNYSGCLLVLENPGTSEKSWILERGPRNPENPDILLIIPENFQNNTHYLFKQETMMINNCTSQNAFAIININKEERKLIFWLPLSEQCWKKQQTCSICWRVVLLLRVIKWNAIEEMETFPNNWYWKKSYLWFFS